VQALAGSLTVLAFAVTGITNKGLRAWMTGLLGAGYTMNQASYDLARLRRKGLIRRIEHTNTYTLTRDGQAFTIFYSKVHDRVLYPLMAPGQPLAVPIEVRRALRTIERHIDDTVTAAALTPAA
jgi:predicted MarR family transcription regulator